MKYLLTIPLFGIAIACGNMQQTQDETTFPTTGTIERLDPALDTIIDPAAKAEIIAEGFHWSEGPLWVDSEQMLLFSDVPTNTVYKWTAEEGVAVYLHPSGYTGTTPSQSREPGSNGLLLDHAGNLVLCQHGNRQIAKMDAPLNQPTTTYTALVDQYEGKRLNSPNDAVYNRMGELFFTDPPYGLPSQNDEDPAKEIAFNGVYKVRPDGEVVLLTKDITRPNGIVFFPGERTLLIASSDSQKPEWYLVDDIDSLTTPVLFYSAINEREGVKGLPDGLKIDKNGNVFASGPGGIWIFNAEGKVLGKLKLDEAASNVAFSADEKTLYVTNNTVVLRLKMRD